MTWPGSQLPPGARAPRRKGKRRGTGGAQRWITREARKAKLIPAAPSPRVLARCPSHVPHEALGFVSGADFQMYCDALARRGPTLARKVVLPREKLAGMPEALRVVAVLCPACRGRTGIVCPTCQGMPWGVRITLKRGIQ